MKKPFVNYTEEEDKIKAPIAVRLNDREEEMVSIGRYAFNVESKSRVLKTLADIGLQHVIHDSLGVEELHRLTNPRRKVYEQEKPKFSFYHERK